MIIISGNTIISLRAGDEYHKVRAHIMSLTTDQKKTEKKIS